MIRNSSQLAQARKSLAEIEDMVRNARESRTESIRAVQLIPLLRRKQKIEKEIQEFEYLESVSLEEAVSGWLRSPTLLDNVVELLVKLRLATGTSQDELSERLGWQQSNLSRFESRTSPNHTLSKVLEYATALEVYLHVVPSLYEETTEFDFGRYVPLFLHRGILDDFRVIAAEPSGEAQWIQVSKFEDADEITASTGTFDWQPKGTRRLENTIAGRILFKPLRSGRRDARITLDHHMSGLEYEQK